MAGGFRSKLTKEVTMTEVKVATLENAEGVLSIKELPDEVLVGNVSMENAQKLLNKKHGKVVTIVGLKAQTDVYEMPVEEFIKVATKKED